MTQTIYYTGHTQPKVRINTLERVHFYHTPTIEIIYEHPDSFSQVETFLRQGSWLVFLSKNGVQGFHSWLMEQDQSLSRFTTSIWAVGEATGQEVKKIFHQTAKQPQKPSAQGLIQAFRGYRKHPLLLITGHRSRPEFPTWLRREGWKFLQVPVYRTELYENMELQQKFRNSRDDVVVFTAPSTVQGFLKSITIPDLATIQAHLVSIGPATTAEIESQGGKVFYESPVPNVSHIVTTLVSSPILEAKAFK